MAVIHLRKHPRDFKCLNGKKEFIQRSGGGFLERMNQYPLQVAEMRGDKDIGMVLNDSPIREYQNILDEMIAIYKSIGE